MQTFFTVAKWRHIEIGLESDMADGHLVRELDRNMDTVFDSLYVLNSAMQAIVESLPPAVAAQAVPRMDAVIDGMNAEKNPPSEFHQLTLNGWRNMAAKLAGLPLRKLPA